MYIKKINDKTLTKTLLFHVIEKLFKKNLFRSLHQLLNIFKSLSLPITKLMLKN